jgi:ADP-L-glycero-D-manno-heptose 6-epimerase
MIVVTGGAGFIGSVLVKALNEEGHKDILILDRISGPKNCLNLYNCQYHSYMEADDFFESEKGQDFHSKITSIFHMGACSSTTEVDKDFLRKNNVEYSQKIFNLASELQIPLLYASSAATYGDGEEGYSDDHSLLECLRPLNLYGDSKQVFDLWALKQKKKPPFWCGLKFFNVYGPNEYHKGDMRSLVHKAFGQINEKGQVALFKSYKKNFKDGEQLRDFIYVKDVVRAMILMWKKGDLKFCGVYNLGTGKARSFIDLVGAVFDSIGRGRDIKFIEMPDKIKDQYQYFTEAKMAKFKTFLPDFEFSSLEEGVNDYICHYLSRDNSYF